MSNNTTVSSITKPTEYTLLDNNHKYLPRKFTFVPTVSSKSKDNDITETVTNALNDNNYYTCTPQDFICKIEVKNSTDKDIVYKQADRDAYVYKYLDSDTNQPVYKWCTSDTVDIGVLGAVNEIGISNVTVKKGEKVLKSLNSDNELSYSSDKKITVPNGYDSLEINSSNVFFRKENDKETYVTIAANNTVSFSNNIKPSGNIIEFSVPNFKITLNNVEYSANSMIEEDFVNAYAILQNHTPNKLELIIALGNEISALVKTAPSGDYTYLSGEANTFKATTNPDDPKLKETLEVAIVKLDMAASKLELAASDLKYAASDLKYAASELKTTTQYVKNNLETAFLQILKESLKQKQQELFNSSGCWIKSDSVNISDGSLGSKLFEYKTLLDKIQSFENVNETFQGLMAMYAIYDKSDNIGLADMSTGNVVVIDNPVLKGVLEYYPKIDKSNLKETEIVALDKNNKMIIDATKSTQSYNLVYLDKDDIRVRILPKGDDFLGIS